MGMDRQQLHIAPAQCPSCASDLVITRLQCPACGTEVVGSFTLGRLAALREPHASLLELFLRVRGNVKDMERELGLSYPTVRARLEEALAAAGLDRTSPPGHELVAPGSFDVEVTARRAAILDQLERKEITASDAAARLRELR